MPLGRDHKQEGNPDALRLSAIVPASDGPATLDRCLGALERSTRPPDDVVAVTEPAGCGPAAARNAGAARTRGDVLVFVDSDVEVHEDALERIRQAFASDPRLSALFGSYDDAPAHEDAVSRFRNLLHHHVHATGAGEVGTFWAGLGAVRRDAFEAAGGFDATRFPRPAVEDIDLGMRLKATGARIRLDPAIRGKHLKVWGLGEMIVTDFACRGVPWTRLQLEAGTPAGELNLAWRHRLGALAALAGAAALAARRPRVLALALAGQLAAHVPFYALLARRGGPRLLGLGVALHALHHLTAIAAAASAVVLHLQRSPR